MRQQPLNFECCDIKYLYQDLQRQAKPDHFGTAMRIAKKISHSHQWKLSVDFFREIQAGIKAATQKEAAR
jgi:hypothetical protein